MYARAGTPRLKRLFSETVLAMLELQNSEDCRNGPHQAIQIDFTNVSIASDFF